MQSNSGSPQNIDYQPTMNVAAAHAAVAREKEDQPVKNTPITLDIVAAIVGIGLLAGAYIGANTGAHYNLQGTTYQAESPPGSSTAAELPEDVKWIKEGEKIYSSVCQGCHQQAGQGVPGQFPPLAGSEYVTAGDERLTAIVLKGMSGPITVKGAQYGAAVMNAKGGQALTPKAVGQVVSYIRNAWGNKGSFVMDDQVKELDARLADVPSPMPSSHLTQLPADKMLPPSKKPLGGAAPAPAAAPAGK